MQKLMQFSYANPRSVIFIIFIVSLFAAFQVPHLQHDPSSESMTLSDDPARDLYEDTLKTFGSDKITVIFVRDPDLFSPRALERLEDLVYSLEDLPGVTRVESLFSVTRFINEGGALDPSPLLDWVPETNQEALRIRQDALSNPMLVDILASRGG